MEGSGGQWRPVRVDFRSLFTPGHVLSMPHDDSKTCARLFGPMGKHHMMAPLFVHLNKTLPWSPCSAMYLTELLDGGHGRCPSGFSLLLSGQLLVVEVCPAHLLDC